MVPPEEIELNAPTTLPADFGEWDSGDAHEAQPVSPSGFDGFPGSVAAPKPIAKPVTARVAVLPAAGRAPNTASRRPAAAYADVEQVYQQPQYQGTTAADQKHKAESKGKRKGMGLLVAAGSLAALLVLGALGYSHLRSGMAGVKSSAAAQPTTMANTLKPTPATPANANTPTATTETEETDRPLRSQSDAMNHQLNAPSRIPSDLKTLAGKEAPPTSGFGASGMEGLGASGGGVFSGHAGPKVKVAAPTKVSVSAGVAVGLLIQRTAPVYPPIAKSARVSGTVVIQATISKTGSVVNPRVVSGPTMLRESALNAVKTWRFRPYLLDGEPVEVETTVNVVFAL